ncbi:hypothetical protein GF318_04260 [Candidatus Micrarchaeota archaeon]|nr:hypothetical protein [Candidatus Micrarchaeota archaeon]
MRAFIFILLGTFLLLGCAAPEAPVEEPPAEEGPPQPPPAVTCVDGDSGIDLAIQGVVVVGNESYLDQCVDNTTVREYYCDGNSMAETTLVCPDDNVCRNGSCVQLPEPGPEPNCVETDSGKDFYSAGTTTYLGSNYSDVCQGNFDLLEYFCENDEISEEIHHCSTGENCVQGACVPQEKTCSDPDSGNPSAAGTTTQYMGGAVVSQSADYCIDGESRVEYYCESNMVKNSTEICPADSFCLNGACVPLCADGDSGRDYFVSSYVDSYSGQFNDYCSDENTVVEYYCSDNSALSEQRECTYFCYSGRCLSSEDIKCKESGSAVKVEYGKIELAEYENSCLDHRLAREYLCVGNDIETVTTQCEDGEICYEGDCMEITEEACYDLDSNEDDDGIFVQSTVVRTDNDSVTDTKVDSCVDSRTVLEYMCDGKTFSTEFLSCPDEYKCIGGECVYPYQCTETDGGKSFEPGEASLLENGDVARTEKDACTGDGNIWEVYCSDDMLEYAVLECPEGTSCNSETGRCE